MKWRVRKTGTVACLLFGASCLGMGILEASEQKKEEKRPYFSQAYQQRKMDRAWKELLATSATAREVEKLLAIDERELRAQLEHIKLELLKEHAAQNAEARAVNPAMVPGNWIEPETQPTGDFHLGWPPKGQPRLPRLDRPAPSGPGPLAPQFRS